MPPTPNAGTSQGASGTNANEPTGAGSEAGGDEKITVTAAELSTIVNQAVTSQLKRAFSKEIAPMLNQALDPFKAQLAALQPKPEEQAAQQGKPSPAELAAQKRIEELEAKFKASEDARVSGEKRSREDSAFSRFVSSLSGKVRAGYERDVATLLKAKGNFVVDDDGNATVRLRGSRAKGLAEEDLDYDIDEGISQFLKSPSAAVFVPPPAAGGSGSEGRKTNGHRGPPPKYDGPAQTHDEALRRTAEALEARGLSTSVLD
jgi:hypothetical protein